MHGTSHQELFERSLEFILSHRVMCGRMKATSDLLVGAL